MQLIEVGLIQSVSSPRTDRISTASATPLNSSVGSTAKLYLSANDVFARLELTTSRLVASDSARSGSVATTAFERSRWRGGRYA